MGTDSPQMFNVPGFALHREIDVMSQAGLTNYQVLASGTVNVSRYAAGELNRSGSFGTVAVGLVNEAVQKLDICLRLRLEFVELRVHRIHCRGVRGADMSGQAPAMRLPMRLLRESRCAILPKIQSGSA